MVLVLVACGPGARHGGGDGGGSGSDGGPPTCATSHDDMGTASRSAPTRRRPGAFEPDIQWTWTGATEPYSIVTPLVANLTDDNARR